MPNSRATLAVKMERGAGPGREEGEDRRRCKMWQHSKRVCEKVTSRWDSFFETEKGNKASVLQNLCVHHGKKMREVPEKVLPSVGNIIKCMGLSSSALYQKRWVNSKRRAGAPPSSKRKRRRKRREKI